MWKLTFVYRSASVVYDDHLVTSANRCVNILPVIPRHRDSLARVGAGFLRLSGADKPHLVHQVVAKIAIVHDHLAKRQVNHDKSLVYRKLRDEEERFA